MNVHLDAASPAPVAFVPGAGVVLVHQCDTAEQRATCLICPDVTPESAACHALQALEAAGVEHDPGETWSQVRREVAEQLAWRQTVASLASGELAAEPEPAARVLEHAGPFLPPVPAAGGLWSDEPVTDQYPAWTEHTSPIPSVAAVEPEPVGPWPVRLESSRTAWVRTAVILAALVVSVGGGVGYVVGSRPDVAQGPAEGGGTGQPARQEVGDDTSRVATGDASRQPGGDGSQPGRGQSTPTVPPTPTPGAPSSSPTLPAGNRTTTPTAPAGSVPQPEPSASSSAPAADPSPSASDPGPATDPEPTPDTTTTAPTCVLDVISGLCVVSEPVA